MKKLFLIGICLFLCFRISAQSEKAYAPPALSDAGSWSMILLPDPQTYVKFDYNQPLFELMTAWIAHHIEPLQIGLVLCTGDLVEQNEYPNPDGVHVNQPSKSQWEAVARSFCRLDGKTPYMLATGNHDYGFRSAENRKTNFDKYFPVDKNWLNQRLLREVGTNSDGMPTLANAVFEYASPHGKKFLVLVLEFAPRDETIEWAKKTIAQEKYAAHTVILLTHSYLNARNEHIADEGYKLEGPNYGAAIWQKLVQPSKNIQMVLAGHIGAPNNVKAHLAFRTDPNAAGKKVHQMVFNAQALGGGWHGNGGDGWLRILEFLPDGKTVKVKTFSPLFAASPTTRQFAWRTEPHDEFTFVLE
ncbi:MAG: metallophosphoesterase [Bacteroidales bacterium]|nr:metallophosphoesterase [Bacteroidales bacterium]